MLFISLGGPSIKLQTTNAAVLIDPMDGTLGLKVPRLKADLVLVSKSEGRTHDAGGEDAFLIDTPGEFEIKGIAVYGIPSSDNTQTFFVLEAEDMRVGFLGDLNRQLDEKEAERLDGVDILLIPVGGHGVLDSRKAQELISELEPRVVIPINFKVPGLKSTRDPVATFCKDFGVKDSTPHDKVRLVKKDLPQEETQVIILAPSHD